MLTINLNNVHICFSLQTRVNRKRMLYREVCMLMLINIIASICHSNHACTVSKNIMQWDLGWELPMLKIIVITLSLHRIISHYLHLK